jgi:hypothetical protein
MKKTVAEKGDPNVHSQASEIMNAHKDGALSFLLGYRGLLYVRLWQSLDFIDKEPTFTPEVKAIGIKHIRELLDHLTKNRIDDIDRLRSGELKISVNEKYTKEITKADIDRIFEDTVIVHILNGLEKELKALPKNTLRDLLPKKEKLHKQPRSLLKTVGQNISNTTEAPGLFTLPQTVEPGGGAIGELKEEISKNTGALAFYLIQKYQENNSRPLNITNLNEMADVMNCNNYRLKLYLLYLGGYVYPIVDRDEKTKELVLTNEQLFKIEFRYGKQVAEKYSVNGRGEIQGVERVGTKLLTFIKDEPLDRVVITPNQRFIKALEGKGLGNILTVNNKFVGLILELTDIATKILCYSSSNKPTWKIAEDNLIKHLGLTKQIKKQGKPRVRATIIKGLQELQDKGHIKNYEFDPVSEIYKYTYSDKYVKYKDSKRDKKEPQEGVQ